MILYSADSIKESSLLTQPFSQNVWSDTTWEHGLLLLWQISYLLFILNTSTSSGNLDLVFLLSFVDRTSKLNCFYQTIAQTIKQECFHQFICKQIYYSNSLSFPCVCVLTHVCGCRYFSYIILPLFIIGDRVSHGTRSSLFWQQWLASDTRNPPVSTPGSAVSPCLALM